ncbi:hypothetical protein N0V86_007451 [Didymella sp. IMI 355093]|nr:hypothetical protein N0V86_007451 [Didymella sp. IMI 355093]
MTSTRDLNFNLEAGLTTQELESYLSSTLNRPFPNLRRHYNFHKWTPYPPEDNGTFLASDIVLSNADWKRMSHYTGAWCYMRDDGLDMALKVLSHSISAPTHGIAICTSVDSQVCMDRSLGGKEDYPTRFGQ